MPPKVGSCGSNSKLWIRARVLSYLLLLSLVMTPAAFAEQGSLLEAAQKHRIISGSSEIYFAELAGKSYLVAIGLAELKGPDPKNILTAKTIAKTFAKKALANFVHSVNISSNETMTSEHSRLVVERDGKRAQVTDSDRSKYEATISEKGEGLIRNFIDVGDWANGDERDYFYCLALEL